MVICMGSSLGKVGCGKKTLCPPICLSVAWNTYLGCSYLLAGSLAFGSIQNVVSTALATSLLQMMSCCFLVGIALQLMVLSSSSHAIFGKTAGLDINPNKSSIFFGGVSPSQKLRILHTTGFREGCFPFTYLRVPLSPHRLIASQFSPSTFLGIVCSRLDWQAPHFCWKARAPEICFIWEGTILVEHLPAARDCYKKNH